MKETKRFRFVVRFLAFTLLATVVVFFHNPIVLVLWILVAGPLGSRAFGSEGQRLRRFLMNRRTN